jgi:CTP synthase
VIEYARHVLGLVDATSGEFDPDAEHPVVVYMPEISQTHLGGTMRLGARRSRLLDHTLAMQVYGGEPTIVERHRHRYEVNPEYVQQLSDAGLVFSGVDDDEKIRMECVELRASASHPFFLGVQYHPEFLSRPLAPSPPFLAFVQAAAGKFVKKDVVGATAAGKKAASSGRASPSVGNGRVSPAQAAQTLTGPAPSPVVAAAAAVLPTSPTSSSSSLSPEAKSNH